MNDTTVTIAAARRNLMLPPRKSEHIPGVRTKGSQENRLQRSGSGRLFFEQFPGLRRFRIKREGTQSFCPRHRYVFGEKVGLAEQVAVFKGGTTGSDYVKIVEARGLHAFLIQPPFEDLLAHVEKGRPVIVGLPERGGRHAMVPVGYDIPGGKVWLNDPASGERKAHAIDAFRRQWEKEDRWTFLIVPR